MVIFKIVERYTEDFVFLFFFLLSGLHLDIHTIPHSIILILAFVALRVIGKFWGVWIGTSVAKSSAPIKKYTAAGLIPQAGVVIGLALSLKEMPQFHELSDIILSVIMGATIIHEIIGPIAAKKTLLKAGEIDEIHKKLKR